MGLHPFGAKNINSKASVLHRLLRLLVGRCDVLGSCGYIRHFFKLFWIEFGADGMCGSWTTEWRFERTDGVLWGSLGGEVGQIPAGNGGLLGDAPLLDDDF